MSIALPYHDIEDTGPFALVGKATARPVQAEALEARLLALVPPTRSEPGVVQYHVHRDRGDMNTFVFYEVWRSRAELAVHLEQPYIQAFLADRMGYLQHDMEIQWLSMRSALE